MTYNVEYTDEFGSWWSGLSEREMEDVDAAVHLLEERGPTLPHPYSSGIKGSRHSHMRELRIQSGGRPIRVLYCFDPRRTGILLLGGDKTGDKRWYETNVPIADNLYDVYLDELKREGLMPKKLRSTTMTGHSSFSKLREAMSPKSQARARAKADELRTEMSLHDLRRAAALTQKQLAAVMEVDQPSVARMEKRTDMYVSSLRRFIEAMGGELQVMARMPGGDVEITNFESLVDHAENEDQADVA